MPVIYDTEIYPNCFLLCIKDADSGARAAFEISPWRNDAAAIVLACRTLASNGQRMVGFNNEGFDYPLLHMILTAGVNTVAPLYQKSQAIFNDGERFRHLIRPSDRVVPQVDLLKIHHFDNKAKMTGLKTLEFNMRMPNISDLPFPPGTILTREQVEVLREYCWDDVDATEHFYRKTLPQIQFRSSLSLRYKRDFTNFSDVKIGREIFVQQLEKAGIPCYSYSPEEGRQPKQTPRASIALAQCVPSFIRFEQPGFRKVQEAFQKLTISKTKNAFNLSATVGGLDFKFGTGGVHASVEHTVFEASDDWMIYDVDVTSLYPSIAIEHGYYPEHLGPGFVKVYRALREERSRYPKGTPENAMLKLALNGVYGSSNEPYGPFFDPLFTMNITIGGQLMIAMLAECLLDVPFLRIIQANTDGITMHIPRAAKPAVDAVCEEWESLTRLQLEFKEYRVMAIADVNSYLAVDTKGEVKRTGRYEHAMEWHQDASALVVPKVAEIALTQNIQSRDTILQIIRDWPDRMDFMLRAKVNRGSHLVLDLGFVELPLDRTQRYYLSESGGRLIKYMPPLPKNPHQWRRIGIQAGLSVCPCNNLRDAQLPINYRWYADEVYKLVLRMK